MNSSIKIFADFNNADNKGRIRLNTEGTYHDLQKLGIEMGEGIEVLLDDNEGRVALGYVTFSDDEKIWVAQINWDEII